MSITITSIYDDARPRRALVAIRYRCGECEATWDDPDPHATYTTSSHFDAQCEKHLTVCPARKELR